MAKRPDNSTQSYVVQKDPVKDSSTLRHPPDSRTPSWQPPDEVTKYLEKINQPKQMVNEAAPLERQEELNTCPMCIEMAKLNQARVSTFCEHTPEQLRKYQELQAQPPSSKRAQADSPVTKKCENCTIMGGTKKKSRRLRRRKSKSKIQRRGKSVKRRRQ